MAFSLSNLHWHKATGNRQSRASYSWGEARFRAKEECDRTIRERKATSQQQKEIKRGLLQPMETQLMEGNAGTFRFISSILAWQQLAVLFRRTKWTTSDRWVAVIGLTTISFTSKPQRTKRSIHQTTIQQSSLGFPKEAATLILARQVVIHHRWAVTTTQNVTFKDPSRDIKAIVTQLDWSKARISLSSTSTIWRWSKLQTKNYSQVHYLTRSLNTVWRQVNHMLKDQQWTVRIFDKSSWTICSSISVRLRQE